MDQPDSALALLYPDAEIRRTDMQRNRGLSNWFLASLLLIFSSARADGARPLQAASEALAAGEYGRAYGEFLYQAETAENPLAQFNLALFHENGWGRPTNQAEACRWHEKAAKGGIALSSHRFAACLLRGTVGDPDPAAAVRWFRTAAELGHYGSLCDLAEHYIRGDGVPKDPAKGMAFCEEAAQRGSPQAQLSLAVFHLEGAEPVRDYNRGVQWLESAASQGLGEAQYRLGELILDRSRDESRQTEVEIARYWLETAASGGYSPAYVPLGELYWSMVSQARTTPEEEYALAKAYLWLSAAARSVPVTENRTQVETLLSEVREIMPTNWVPMLDAKVEEHIALVR
ncbi:MAG: tetratricopeptide repeat protein [Thiohalocapsa sp.]